MALSTQALRATLRKLYLGKDAPWDADDEREAKAAAAAEQRRVVQDEDGRVVKSRRQGKKEELSAAFAAAAVVAESAPEGWGRAAKRHPNLAAIFAANAARGPDAALKEARAAAEQCVRVLREKTSTQSFLQAKLDRCDLAEAAEAAGGGAGGGGEAGEGAEGTEGAEGAEGAEAAQARDVAALEAETCPICFTDDRDATSWMVAPCGHAGCYECIVGWVEERSSCPVCKAMCTVPLLYEVAPPPPPPPPPLPPLQPPEPELVEGVVGAVGGATTCTTSGAAWLPSVAPLGGGLDKALVREYGTKIAALVQLVGQAAARGDKVVRAFRI